MFILYDLIFLLFAVIYLPLFLLGRKFHRGFALRLGILPKDLNCHNPIWIHAVSVGEALAIRVLLKQLREACPHKRFVISTVTATGNKIARGIAAENDFVFYLPLDLSFIVKKVIDKIEPAVFIIAETELWPNLISYLYKKNIPVVVVNGRLSDISFRRYLGVRFLIKPVLDKVNLFCVQTLRDSQRLERLGLAPEKIRITGNMKFDTTPCFDSANDSRDFRAQLGIGPEEGLLVAGSTHAGEERIILDVYKELLAEFPGLRVVVAPRHPARAKDIAAIVSGLGLRSVFISRLPMKQCACVSPAVFILDTIGQLISFYNVADIVFVGGSLTKKGGHNILEPASLGRPVIFGPHMFNFRDSAELFLENEASIQVQGKEGLRIAIRDLLSNACAAEMLGRKAKELVSRNRGASGRNLEYIRKVMGTRQEIHCF